MKAQNITIDINRLTTDQLKALANITYKTDSNTTTQICNRIAFQEGWMNEREEAEYLATYC